MKKVSLFVLLGAVMAVFVPLGASTAQAQEPPPWQTARWSGLGSTVVTTTLTGPETLQVTDFQCVGDRFTVFIDGVSVGSTSDTPVPDDCGLSSIDEACALGTFSSGSFAIPAGDHTVEIRHLSGFSGGSVAFRLGPVGCNNAVLGDGSFQSVTALCIEDDYVQANAQGQRVGNVFSGATGPTLIATGAPTCQFNCLDGFDINCDGTIGDFCPVELDRELVDDVQPCLAANEPVVADVASVPAAPIALEPPTLAFTGAETDVLGMIGAGMLGMGALALAGARRSRRRTLQ